MCSAHSATWAGGLDLLQQEHAQRLQKQLAAMDKAATGADTVFSTRHRPSLRRREFRLPFLTQCCGAFHHVRAHEAEHLVSR